MNEEGQSRSQAILARSPYYHVASPTTAEPNDGKTTRTPEQAKSTKTNRAPSNPPAPDKLRSQSFALRDKKAAPSPTSTILRDLTQTRSTPDTRLAADTPQESGQFLPNEQIFLDNDYSSFSFPISAQVRANTQPKQNQPAESQDQNITARNHVTDENPELAVYLSPPTLEADPDVTRLNGFDLLKANFGAEEEDYDPVFNIDPEFDESMEASYKVAIAKQTTKRNSSRNSKNRLLGQVSGLIQTHDMSPVSDSAHKSNYQITVHIKRAIQLQKTDDSANIDPVAELYLFGIPKYTRIVDNSHDPVWNSVFEWVFHGTQEALEKEVLRVNVFDSTNFPADLLGFYEFCLGAVFQGLSGDFSNSWFALIHPEDGQVVSGYMQSTIEIKCHGKDVNQKVSESKQKSKLFVDIVLPPSLKPKQKLFICHVYKAEHLPKVDLIGKSDPYVVLRYENNAVSTTVKEKELNPVWNEILEIPVTIPSLNNVVTLQIYDQDQGSSDDVIATHVIDIHNAIHDGHSKKSRPFWINLYGAPVNSVMENESDEMMNEGAIPGIHYRGRVLVYYYVQDAEFIETKPRPKSIDIEPAKKAIPIPNPKDPPANGTFCIQFDLYEANLLVPAENVIVKIYVGNYVIKSKIRRAENGIVRWYTYMESLKMILPQNEKSWPDLIINLKSKSTLKGSSRIGGTRFKLVSFLGKHNDAKWVPLYCNEANDKEIAAHLLFRTNFGPISELPIVHRAATIKPKTGKFKLIVHLGAASDLIAADSDGFSDPFCKIRMGSTEEKSRIIEKTLNPVWNAKITLKPRLPLPLNLAPHVFIEVYDYDINGDDLLGLFSVSPEKILKMAADKFEKFDLRLPNSPIIKGHVYASFRLLDLGEADESSVANEEAESETAAEGDGSDDFIADVYTLGVREMKKVDGKKITKPQVAYDIMGEHAETKQTKESSGCNTSIIQSNTTKKKKKSAKAEATQKKAETSGKGKKGKEVEAPVETFKDEGEDQKLLIGKASIPITYFTKNKGFESPYVKNTLNSQRASLAYSQSSGSKFDAENSEKQGSTRGLSPNNQVIGLDEKTPLMSKPAAQNSTKLKPVEDIMIGTADENHEEIPLLNCEWELKQKDPPFAIVPIYSINEEVATENQDSSLKTPAKQEGNVIGYLKFNVKTSPASGGNSQNVDREIFHLYEKISQPVRYVVRLYVLSASQLLSHSGKVPNPYVTLTIGPTSEPETSLGQAHKREKKKNEEDILFIDGIKEFLEETSEPMFESYYELQGNLTDHPLLVVSVRDFQTPETQLIGNTVIDLENRFLSREWEEMALKPIETRNLWNPIHKTAQGQVRMIIEILTVEESIETPLRPIPITNPIEFEIRLVIWSIKDIRRHISNAWDLFISTSFQSERQDTSVMKKYSKGLMPINWRVIFPVVIPSEFTRVRVLLWDHSRLQPGYHVGEANLNLRNLFESARKARDQAGIGKQWVDLAHPNESRPVGKLEFEVEVLPRSVADEWPVGRGREPPNERPYLPEPVYRRPDTIEPAQEPEQVRINFDVGTEDDEYDDEQPLQKAEKPLSPAIKPSRKNKFWAYCCLFVTLGLFIGLLIYTITLFL